MYDQVHEDIGRLWALTLGEPDIRIAIIDGPAELDHPALAGAQLSQVSIYGDDEASCEPSDHGTHVSSIIFGQHHSLVKGIAPQVTGIIIPLFEMTSDKKVQLATQLDLARAINKAIQHKVHVINISAGELDDFGEPDEVLARALEQCDKENILVVAAAGNNGCRCLHVPAAVPTVLTVGAMDISGIPLPDSNWGDAYLTNGLLAPGRNINGALTNGRYGPKSGTSFATPYVSGVVALLLSLLIKRGEQPDPHRIKNILLQTANPCPDRNIEECSRFLRGTLNVQAALQELILPAKVRPAERMEDFTSGAAQLATPIDTNSPLINIKNSSTMENVHKKLSELDQDVRNEGASVQVQLSESLELQPMENFSEAKTNESLSQAISDITVTTDLPRISPSEIEPSCGCGCGGKKESGGCSCGGKKGNAGATHQKVYALGTIGYDFVNESRRDSFLQHINDNLNDPQVVIDHLESGNMYEATELIWTLEQEGTPIYAIHPLGAYAHLTYERLVDSLKGQLEENGVERVAVPGIIAGKVTLLNGQVVPAIVPSLRGMAEWSTQALAEAVGDTSTIEALANFLERVYYEFRNFGLTPQERALNYAATNAFTANSVFQAAAADSLQLTDIKVTKSPIVRPGVDGYDVQLIFFDPLQRYEKARKVYRYTVDVSDVVPVTIGSVRSWYIH
ncbi:PatA/PatG family cyanobactin maturation protease [Flavilitoribacter nigricans]|uniref:Peptidase S8 n=1 Tax=Flavilitoribacter nigricans (strain ATCC 23147 / DSM 23189 / NBRC 102662 / NCIMB 1420 / SS-2) TaxID=1122177 RepID=A0A2D0NBT6_FLAN2|nr:PatA/PatG family cyanobactin maturation protease [Flavilitoribacter nigricans]PHN05972.1 peptidase S8 [Flavilitoribacter nigricans DSM 23189 = NBRC 102662]